MSNKHHIPSLTSGKCRKTTMHFKKHAVQNTTQVIFYPSNHREITATSSLLLINSSKNVTVDTVFARNAFFLLHLAVDYLVCFDRTVSPWCQSILFLFFCFFLQAPCGFRKAISKTSSLLFFSSFFHFQVITRFPLCFLGDN